MIDIHCHRLFQVDDGSKSLEESVEMLRIAKEQKITAIILTPHYRHGMFGYPKNEVDANFAALQPYAAKLGIDLHLGTEYHVNSRMMEAFLSGRCHTLAGSRYILTEYSGAGEYTFMEQMTQEAIRYGYIPVIAHVERYRCIVEQPERAAQLQRLGAWIQVNADAVLGLEGWGPKRFCKRLLKEGWVDVVASDCHGIRERACHLDRCYALVEKKYGHARAEELFCENPGQILHQ